MKKLEVLGTGCAKCDKLAELSGGKLTVKQFPGGALNKTPPKQYSIMLDGVTDIAYLRSSNKQRLALGVFSTKAAALKRLQLLKGKGFDSEIIEFVKSVNMHLADIAYQQSSASNISKRVPSKYQSACSVSTELSLLQK